MITFRCFLWASQVFNFLPFGSMSTARCFATVTQRSPILLSLTDHPHIHNERKGDLQLASYNIPFFVNLYTLFLPPVLHYFLPHVYLKYCWRVPTVDFVPVFFFFSTSMLDLGGRLHVLA